MLKALPAHFDVIRSPQREHSASSLNYANGDVIATTYGYIGDQPPYVGHVAVINSANGAASARVELALLQPPRVGSRPARARPVTPGIWGRAGAVVVPGSGDLLVATGNANWNGSTDWATRRSC